MNIDVIREAMAGALRSIDGLNASPYLVERINGPHAMIDWSVPDYHVTFEEKRTYAFTVQVFGQRTDAEQTQRFFDLLRDSENPQSVPNVLEDDDGLAAVVEYVHVSTASAVSVVAVGAPEVQYLMIVFEVEIGA